MTAKGHMVTGLFGLSLVLYFDAIQNNLYDILSFSLGTFLGVLLPDIDEPKSYIGRKFSFVSTIISDLGIEHRTWTHSFIFALIFFIGGLLTGSLFFYGLFFGIVLHQIGDMLTKGGIKGYFTPIFSSKTIRLVPRKLAFYTGGATEIVLILLMVSVSIYLIVMKYIYFVG